MTKVTKQKTEMTKVTKQETEMKKEMSPIDAQIAREAESLERTRETWALHKEYLEPLIDKLVKVAGVSVTLYNWGMLTMSCHGDKDRLVKVMRVLRGAGYTADRKPEKHLYEYEARWTQPINEDGFQRIAIKLYFYSTVCRRVQIGTQMVEQPLYAVKCGDAD
jgi:hypothetical protein